MSLASAPEKVVIGAAELWCGDSLEVLPCLPRGGVDAVVCDPPYGLSFMGRRWDYDVPSVDLWREALLVMKPGAHLLAFGGTRTYHRMVCAIEDAGFEIRDQIGWVFGSGFPKSKNLGGDWFGWGSALKPAWELLVLARAPLAGTLTANMQAHGTGALNIDGCRIEANGGRPHRVIDPKPEANGAVYAGRQEAGGGFDGGSKAAGETTLGRWPANLIHDGSAEVVSEFPADAGAAAPVLTRRSDKFRSTYGAFAGNVDEAGRSFHGDSGSASRFFYCAKASRDDRDDGCEVLAKRPLRWSSGEANPGSFQAPGTDKSARNHHPTVKPTDLMRYLCRLITPPGGVVLDPFMGSGSTGRGALLEGFRFVGIERDTDYFEIARARIARVAAQGVLHLAPSARPGGAA